MARDSPQAPACQAGPEPFVIKDGVRFARTSLGLVFCPEYNPVQRKHPCKDCMTCAFCADSRCSACLGHGREGA